MGAFLLALEIEPVLVNKVYVALPLHCTVVHWFRSNKSPANVLTAITDIVQQQAPIELVSGAPDLFGVDKDVPVNLLVNEQEVHDFHARLHDALQEMGITDVSVQWTKDGFTPHVTRQKSGRFETGRSFTATKLYLVEAMMADKLQQKKVIAKILLGRGKS
jgi:2'-5' RNA ligase